MRVVAQIPHSHCAVTLHSYNEKYILRIEHNGLAIEYKFRPDEIQNLEEWKKSLTESYIDSLAPLFMQLKEKRLGNK